MSEQLTERERVNRLLAQFWEMPLTEFEEMPDESRGEFMDRMAEERVKDLERAAIARRLEQL